MSVGQFNHLARIGVAVAACLGATSGACSKDSTQSRAQPTTLTSGSAPPQTFRFAPPDGIEFIREDHRKDEIAIVGAPLRRVDEEALRWKVGIKRKGEQYRVRQDLVHVTLKRDGKSLVDSKVEKGISAELIIDHDGNLIDVKGLEKTAARLRELAAPGSEAAVAQTLTPEYLSDVVANRYRILYGETIGRQASPGSSWTVTNPPGSFVASRKVKVERYEQCGAATCARMRVDFKVDQRVMTDAAVDVVRSYVLSSGGDPSNVRVKSASYGMSGAMLNEPSTMLSHGASFAEVGTVNVAGPSNDIAVNVKGTTELVYKYPSATPPAAQNSAPEPAAEVTLTQ
jgi:hypothetical protein